ncbi:hypothetical protein [Streptomyces sp. BF23-19]|uniref:hypothetical protein n=1 Tax=unclassified Streptomyces TaxID=2593676 RepID=UPI0034E5D2B6
MVRLHPKITYRRILAEYLRASAHSKEMLHRYLGVSPGTLTGYLNAELVPDPATFLRLRRVLEIPSHEPNGLDHDYIRLLADSQSKTRKRTSKIQDRHVLPTGAPDPLTAESAQELVEKLREVHQWALRPSYRELEKRTGGILKRATLGDMLHPDNTVLPRFDRYACFLEALGVKDLAYWIAAWRRLAPPSHGVWHLVAERRQAELRTNP